MAEEFEDKPEEQEEEKSLEDLLSDAWDEVEAEGGGGQGEEIKEPEGDPEPIAAEGEDLEAQSENDGEVEDTTPILPPHSWPAEDKERFKALPRDAQEVIAKRQADMDRSYYQKSQELAEMRKQYEAFDRIIGQRRKEFAIAGEDPVLAVENALEWRNEINSNPVEGIGALMQQFGLTPEHFVQNNQTQHAQDPQVAALTQEVEQLKGHLTQQQEAQYQGHMQGVQSEIETFASQKDEQGQSRYPYFDRVRDEMVPFVQAIKARDPHRATHEVLAEAYQAAIQINPDTKAALAQTEAQTQAAATHERAEKAKAAGSSINGAPSGSSSFESMPEDLRGVLESSWDRLM